MLGSLGRVRGWGVVIIAACLVLAGCSSGKTTGRAPPVEDRGTAVSRIPAGSAPMPGASAGAGSVTTDANGKPLRGIENAGRPGYYTVKPGDTLMRIALDNGQSWRDIVRWNQIENPNQIEVGEVFRVIPPVSEAVVARPIAPQSAVTASSAPVAPSSAASSARPVPAPAPAPAATGGDEDVGWIWPAAGTLLAGFDENKNKGYDIGGRAGDPILAAGDGRVVYAGAGLRGYGNLVILKHNNTYLTAYAHNQTLLVKEDQNVRKGQKIAEMGSSDTDRVKLHFEIRRMGKPVDPSRYLPSR